MRVPALVWLYFDPPIEDESDKKKSKCKLCPGDKYLTVNNSGTSNLRSHVTGIHKISISNIISPKELAVFFSKSSKHNLREALVEWIVKDSLSFTTVESESFHKLFEVIRNLSGDITIPSAQTIKRDLLARYLASKASLKGILGNISSKISLTTDLWTSNSCKAFLEVTAYWLDNN